MCDHIIKQTRYFGDVKKVRCTKESKFNDESGRSLCATHFKKWFKKKYNSRPEKSDFSHKLGL